MSSEENKILARRYIEETLNKGNLAVIDELVAPDYVDHAAPPGVPAGREGERQRVMMLHSAFPDFHLEVDDMIAEGDMVVTRWTLTGTHSADLVGIAATGKRVAMTGITIGRVVNGKVVENWQNSDDLGLFQQLGVIPTPGQ